MKRRAVFDTGVCSEILGRISEAQCEQLRHYLHSNGIEVWISPTVIKELLPLGQNQREALARRLQELEQPRMLLEPAGVISAEFIAELRRVDPTLARMTVPPSLDIISADQFDAHRLETSDRVIEQAKRQKIYCRLVQNLFKTDPVLQGNHTVGTVKEAYKQWQEQPLPKLEEEAPNSPPKSSKLVQKLMIEFGRFVDRAVRDQLWYDFIEAIITGDRTQNYVARAIIDNYPAARLPEYWDRFAESVQPRNLPGNWLNLAVAAQQMSPKRFNRCGSDCFDSALATYCKAIDILITTDRELENFLKHPAIIDFLAEHGRSPKIVFTPPGPGHFGDLMRSLD